jgi:hypothetical protein
MARVSVEVPAELVEPIRETVLLLYGATAESLRLALKARPRGGHPPGETAPEEIDQHRARLADLDVLLRQLGGSAEPGAAGAPRRVSAPRDLLHDAFYGALIDAGERLADISNRAWRGELPLERVGAAAEEVLAVDRLLRELDGLSSG